MDHEVQNNERKLSSLFTSLWNRGVATKLTNDDFRYFSQMLLISLILGIAASGMAIVCIVLAKWHLLFVAIGFAFVNFLNLFLLRLTRRVGRLNYAILEAAMFTLFVFFLATGGTLDGFGIQWVLLLPACGMMFFGRKRGGILTGALFLLIVFFMFVPIGRSLQYYDYSTSFRIRFPLVYLSFAAAGYSFELIRVMTQRSLVETKNQSEIIASTDQLTGVTNRYGFNERVQKEYAGKALPQDSMVFLVDFDNFKGINDRFGHKVGDDALVAVSHLIRDQLPEGTMFCRWGGEEFLGFLPDCPASDAILFCDNLCLMISETPLDNGKGDTLRMTVSIGSVIIPEGCPIDPDGVFSDADHNLYDAKSRGKNRVSGSTYHQK